MNGLCLKSSILYQAIIKCSGSKYKQKRYNWWNDIQETLWKLQKITQLKNDTTLSIEYWNLKQKQQALRLTWEIKVQYKAYNPTLKKWNLCLNEKLAITDNSDKHLLNKRLEIIFESRNRNKFKLVNPRQVKHQMTSYNKWYPSTVLLRYIIV